MDPAKTEGKTASSNPAATKTKSEVMKQTSGLIRTKSQNHLCYYAKNVLLLVQLLEMVSRIQLIIVGNLIGTMCIIADCSGLYRLFNGAAVSDSVPITSLNLVATACLVAALLCSRTEKRSMLTFLKNFRRTLAQSSNKVVDDIVQESDTGAGALTHTTNKDADAIPTKLDDNAGATTPTMNETADDIPSESDKHADDIIPTMNEDLDATTPETNEDASFDSDDVPRTCSTSIDAAELSAQQQQQLLVTVQGRACLESCGHSALLGVQTGSVETEVDAAMSLNEIRTEKQLAGLATSEIRNISLHVQGVEDPELDEGTSAITLAMQSLNDHSRDNDPVDSVLADVTIAVRDTYLWLLIIPLLQSSLEQVLRETFLLRLRTAAAAAAASCVKWGHADSPKSHISKMPLQLNSDSAISEDCGSMNQHKNM